MMNLVAPSTRKLLLSKKLEVEKQEQVTITELRSRGSEVKIISYVRGKLLGKGGFARCYEMTELDEAGKPVRVYAGKIIPKNTLIQPKHVQKLKTEISIHRTLKHEHIVRFDRSFEDQFNVYILLEKCDHRSMMELLDKRKRLLESEARYYLVQVLTAVKYMQAQRVIHRDLKLGNLLLDKMKVKVADFGLAARVEFDGERRSSMCGTPNYIAPEILLCSGHSYEVDTWAIGIILYTFLVGTPPFETKTVENTYARIKENVWSFPSDVKISDSAKSLIRQILHSVPECRPSLDDILHHRWFEGCVPVSIPDTALISSPHGVGFRSPLSDKTATHNSLQNSKSTTSSSNRNLINVNGKRLTEPYCSKENGISPLLALLIPEGMDNRSSPQRSKMRITSPTRDTYDARDKRNNQEIVDLGNKMTKARISQKVEAIAPPKPTLETMHRKLAASVVKTQVLRSTRAPPAHLNPLWVVKWVDYSDKYGLGYELSDGTFGAYFRDGSRIVLPVGEKTTEYYEAVKTDTTKKTERRVFVAADPTPISSDLQKKFILLKNFKSYLTEQTKEVMPIYSVGTSSVTPVVHVAKWLRTKHAIIFRLSNKTVQVNFFDHTKLLVSSDAEIVTYINKERFKSTHYLSDIYVADSTTSKELGVESLPAASTENINFELVNRLKYTRDILMYMISKQNETKAV